MIKVVIDTNVIISAAISPIGNCAQIIKVVTDLLEIRLFYSAEILLEYEHVLSREHLKIATEKQLAIIDYTIKKFGTMVEPTTSDIPLPDKSDRIFYDTAREMEAILITGNKKHFPQESFIMSPAEFLQMIKNVVCTAPKAYLGRSGAGVINS